MTTVKVLLLWASTPFITYGTMWLTWRCAEDALAVVRHARRH